MIMSALFPQGAPDNLREWGVVMPKQVRDNLIAIQDAAGSKRHRLSPVKLTDGRWALNADVLTEAREGGLFGSPSSLPAEDVAALVVVPWDDVLALLPVPEPEPDEFFPEAAKGGGYNWTSPNNADLAGDEP